VHRQERLEPVELTHLREAFPLVENDGLSWPHRDGLKWPHLSSVLA
jgi:hypothetical protein